MTGFVAALPSYGLWAMGGTVALLAVFFLLRGRIRIEKGWAGFNITRFDGIQRFAHWLLAISFIVLALTGLNIQHGRALLLPFLGDQDFAQALRMSRILHATMAFAFMAGLLLAFLLWVRHSLPHWRDAIWLLKGGGMIVRGAHPPAWKFNVSQKLLFWLVMIGGALLSVTGLALLFTWTEAFSRIIAVASMLGIDASADLNPVQEAEFARTWHSLAAFALLGIVIVHIYMRTAGIQGAFSAMGSGQVDANWARQHHSLWAGRELQSMDESAAPNTSEAHTAAAE